MRVGGLISFATSTLLRRRSITEMREYDSFESALHNSDSYQDPRLIDVVFEKTRLYRQRLSESSPPIIESRQILQNMFVLTYAQASRPINVLEIGGACGAAYFEMQRLLPGRIDQWSIVETPAMVAAGRKLNDVQSLSFNPDCAEAVRSLESRDLAMATGVLQYASDPVQMLKELFVLEFDYVYLSRTVVLADGSDAVTPIFTQQDTQLSAHGPGALPPTITDAPSRQPMVLVDRSWLLASIPASYKLLFVFEEPEKPEVVIGRRTLRLAEIGFLARRL